MMFLAKGGEGEVRIVQDKETLLILIMKTFIDSDLNPDDEALKQELDLIQSLSHPNVSSLQDIFHDERGRLCYTTEISWDFDLSYKIKQRMLKDLHFSEHEIIEILYQFLSGLVYIHNKNICHRDIKAANLIGKVPHRYLLTDFGSAKYLGPDRLVSDDTGDEEEKLTGSMTKTGKKGTATHMAPEVITAKKIRKRKATYTPYDGFKADIYSYAVMLYEIATLGDRPYDAADKVEYFN